MADATILNIGGIDYNVVDASVPSWAKQNTKPSYAANEISGLATVATSGSYNDLSNKPTIPAAVTIDSTWIENSTNPVESQLIQSALTSLESTLENNIPTNISELTDDVGFGKVVYGKYENGNFYPGSYSGPNGNPQYINSPVTPDTTTTYIDIGSHKSYHYNRSSYVRLDDEQQTLPTIGTLNTNNSTAQTASSSESFSSSINLHKVSKTGSYSDLLDKPTIPSVSTISPIMDGTAAIGSSTSYARADHVHPSDTSRVPTSCKINNIPLSSDITLKPSDIGNIVYGKKESSGFKSGALFNGNWMYSQNYLTLEKGVVYIDIESRHAYYYDGTGDSQAGLKEIYYPDLSNAGYITSTTITDLTDIL